MPWDTAALRAHSCTLAHKPPTANTLCCLVWGRAQWLPVAHWVCDRTVNRFVWELIPSPITPRFYFFLSFLCCVVFHKVRSHHWPGWLSHTDSGVCVCVCVYVHVWCMDRWDSEDQIQTVKNGVKYVWLSSVCVDPAQFNCVCVLSSWLPALSQISHPTQSCIQAAPVDEAEWA